MDLDAIKLIIWDLDNTFWSGTISENEIQPISDNKNLVMTLTDCGIINSICSKNTFEVASAKLKELEIFDYFVFPSINWTPKGQRTADMIKTMSLRPENVLFIDDEPSNLEEVKFYSPGIMVALPDIIPQLINFVGALKPSDIKHTRLENYKLLERKNIEEKKFDNNEAFLFASNIKVQRIEECLPELDRIHELISRSNQLNFTKKRISKEELKDLLENKDAHCAYITVNDNFGEYGLVGFYAVLNQQLEHFLFSCRILGLGVEQYLYSKLNFPSLEVVPEVASQVNQTDAPLWVNQQSTANAAAHKKTETENLASTDAKFLIKGPCDLSQMIAYVKNSDMFESEFNYVSRTRRNVIEGHNHSVHLAALKDLSASDKQEILNDCIFIDEEMFSGSLYKTHYDIVFLSTFSESYAGIYKKKNSNIQVTVGSYLFPITDKKYWPGLIQHKLFSGSNQFTEEYLQEFSEKYEFIGKTTPADYRMRINTILDQLDNDTKLCLILGVEFPQEKNADSFYEGRHLSHIELNKEIRDMAHENPRIILFDFNEVVKNQTDFTDNLNQFTSRINFELSQKMIAIINKEVTTQVEHYSTLFVYFDMLLNYTRQWASRILPKDNGVYKNLQEVYYKLSRRR